MSAGPSTMTPHAVRLSKDGFGPRRPVHVAGRARRFVTAPTCAELESAVKGYGPNSVATFRIIAAELLDYRRGRLPRSTASDDDYRAAIEALAAPGTPDSAGTGDTDA